MNLWWWCSAEHQTQVWTFWPLINVELRALSRLQTLSLHCKVWLSASWNQIKTDFSFSDAAADRKKPLQLFRFFAHFSIISIRFYVFIGSFFSFAQKAIRIEFLVGFLYAQKNEIVYVFIIQKSFSIDRHFFLFNIVWHFWLLFFVRLLEFCMQNDTKSESNA